jgi:pimeloyl-ACP methyl ester carboxylesterase
MDLPIDDPKANFDDYSAVVVDALKDEASVVLVGHSRAGNVIPRAASRLATSRLIYLCSSFEPATIGHPTKPESFVVPPRNSETFQQGVVEVGEGLTMFDTQLAKDLFFNDCSPEIQEWAANRLRPQRRSAVEPVLRNWPSVPQDYVVCSDDLVVNPEWSRYASTNWLGIQPIEFPSGHSPFLSKPQQLATMLISLAIQDYPLR